jgi:UDP-N-acetylmuramoylalanine--D-glutamate ligase
VELKNKKVVVVGLGRSGIAAAQLAHVQGARVVGTDTRLLAQLGPQLAELGVKPGVELVLGGHQGVDFLGADLCVVSPGVPTFAELEQAERAGVLVIGELEFGARFTQAQVAAVGGTNGKSTTTTLLECLLAAGGGRVFAGGNLGVPFCEVATETWDSVVLEVSSFQLERAPTFHPRVSILLNVTEDHLDRYPDFQAYADAKGNAFVNQGPSDVAVVPVQDPICLAQARRGNGRIRTFGPGGDYVLAGRVAVEVETQQRVSLVDAQLHGRHNLDNFLAAFAAARALGVSIDAIVQGLKRFTPLHHRMEWVRDLHGVKFYDDSKGTNVGASVTALLGLEEQRAVLIAGGRDKQGSYQPLVEALRQKGRAVVVIGEAAQLIASAVGNALPVIVADSMQQAVERAFQLAEAGDAVLLSPACSSFDMFSGYAARGDAFAKAVRELGPRTLEKP